jgi:hypothetical protein
LIEAMLKRRTPSTQQTLNGYIRLDTMNDITEIIARLSDSNAIPTVHECLLAANLIEQQASRITALDDEVKALRKDAERYKWISDRFVGADFEWNADSEGNGGVPVLCIRMYEKQVVFGDLSMTIDAALSAASDGGGDE